MRTPITRLSVLALFLAALLPADLALARWASRSELPRAAARAGADAVRTTARHTLDTGTRWLGAGADVLGSTLVDAACWVADRMAGPACHAPLRATLGVAPLEVRTRIIVVADDGDCGAIPAPPAAKTPVASPSDS
jgi:hypothetical protein